MDRGDRSPPCTIARRGPYARRSRRAVFASSRGSAVAHRGVPSLGKLHRRPLQRDRPAPPPLPVTCRSSRSRSLSPIPPRQRWCSMFRVLSPECSPSTRSSAGRSGRRRRSKAKWCFAGFGITAPEYQYDDYAKLDVRGKAILIYEHEPGGERSAVRVQRHGPHLARRAGRQDPERAAARRRGHPAGQRARPQASRPVRFHARVAAACRGAATVARRALAAGVPTDGRNCPSGARSDPAARRHGGTGHPRPLSSTAASPRTSRVGSKARTRSSAARRSCFPRITTISASRRSISMPAPTTMPRARWR